MTVQAAKLVNRDVYGITYEGASGEGIVQVRMQNPETGDISTTQTVNDGSFTVTVGTDYEGTSDIEIVDDGGHTVDSGTIVFGGEDLPEAPPDQENDLRPSHPIVIPTPPPDVVEPPHVEHHDETQSE
jgi:hypothetical protein